MSDSVVFSDMLTRIDESASDADSPNAVSALLGVCECDEHAEPLETYIPSPERKWSIVSLLIEGRVKLKM